MRGSEGSEVRGLLGPFLLLLIYERPAPGCDLTQRLAGLGMADVEPGRVYRVLRGLERARSLISVRVTPAGEPTRRRYELTAKGRADLHAWMERLAHLDLVVGGCLARWAQTSAPCTGTLDRGLLDRCHPGLGHPDRGDPDRGDPDRGRPDPDTGGQRRNTYAASTP